MKTRSLRIWLWAGISLIGSYLFYQQSAGINYLVFSILSVILVFGLHPALRQSRQGKAIAFGCLITAAGVVWHHTLLAVLLNWVSFVALAGYCVYPYTSLAAALPNGLYAMLFSIWKGRWLADHAGKEGWAGIGIARVASCLVPVGITVLFLVLYTIANPAFAALVQQAQGEIISPFRLIFTLTCAYGLIALVYPAGLAILLRADQRTPNTLIRQRKTASLFSFSTIALKHEFRAGWLLFILLNSLLLLFNGIDLLYLVTGQLPEGVTYSAYVHQGVTALIISIVLAIGIVMYFFRRNLNFYHRSGQLKMAAYGWICQNILLVLTTAYKNGLYIDAYGLTQKRVGVYVYLALALAGLLTTYMKVKQIKSNAFLLRYNSWVVYTVLAGMTLFNWPRIITKYNLTHLPADQIDFQYLSRLSNNNLDLLSEALHNPAYRLPKKVQSRIKHKMEDLQDSALQQDWRSWNFAEAQVLNQLTYE
ncbi:MAG: DUF4173 domain-containing protein [Cyclobacteriaceae bacterium]